jgi:hypothetical protein
VLALVLLFTVPAGAQLPELRTFACDATVAQQHYHLLLTRSDGGARMQVRSDDALVADGPAISYRSGTRYFIPTGTTTGIKLTVDRDPARICFGAGGTDCYACTAPVETKPLELETITCSRGGYTLSGTIRENAAPLIVVEDERGEVIASGVGSRWGRQSDHFTLPIGPGELYEVDDAVDMCSQTEPAPPSDPPPVDILDVSCRNDDDDYQRLFELHHVGSEHFAGFYYGDAGTIGGPIAIIEGGRYLLFGGLHGTVTYRPLTEDMGEICDGMTCVTCLSTLD